MAIAVWVRGLAVPMPPPGPCDASAALLHNAAAAIEVATAAARDIAARVQNVVMEISIQKALSKIRRQAAPGLARGKILSGVACWSRSSSWRVHSRPIQVVRVRLRAVLRRAFRRRRDTRPKESTHAVHESSCHESFWARRRWCVARARGSSRARQCAVAQQSRRRRGGSGGRPAGDHGSALAAPPPSSLASLAPSSPSSLAPLVSPTARRGYRTGPLHCGPVFVFLPP